MSVDIAEPTLIPNEHTTPHNDLSGSSISEIINDKCVWVADSFSNNCLKCNSQFIPFFNGKHHCRICGLLYCSDCCSNFLFYQSGKISPLKSPFEESESTGPYRTCDNCYNEYKRRALVKTTPFAINNNPKVTKEEECPVCGKSVIKSNHGTIEECLTRTKNNYQQRTNKNNRMLVYNMTATEIKRHKLATVDDFDCPICFEDFCENDKVGRLECLCLYHYDCIKSWFEKKKSKFNSNQAAINRSISRNWCPVHDALS